MPTIYVMVLADFPHSSKIEVEEQNGMFWIADKSVPYYGRLYPTDWLDDGQWHTTKMADGYWEVMLCSTYEKCRKATLDRLAKDIPAMELRLNYHKSWQSIHTKPTVTDEPL